MTPVPMDFLYQTAPGDRFIDVSHYQGSKLAGWKSAPAESDRPKFISLLSAWKDTLGIKGLGIKFTEGLTNADEFALMFATSAQEIGLNWWPYHRFVSDGHPVASGLKQANRLLRMCYDNPSLRPGPPCLDWENIGNEPLLHPYDAITFLERVSRKSGMNGVLYSSKNYLDFNTLHIRDWPNQEWIMDYRLWIASYPVPLLPTSKPLLPAIYKQTNQVPFMWQNLIAPAAPWTGNIDQSVRLAQIGE